MTSATREDYLRAIYHLEDEYKMPVKAKYIVEYLQLSKSTVSERLQGLAEEGLVKHEPYKAVEFTAKGRAIAKKLTFKHRIIEVFLHDLLKMKGDKIHEEAHRLEHAFSDEAINKLSNVLGKPKTDPHGQHIMI